MSDVRQLPGSRAQVNWEYLSQTNPKADCVPPKERFKWCYDLTTVELVNLLTIGLSSYNVRHHVPNDISTDTFYINPYNSKSQCYIHAINSWSETQKMILNQKKKNDDDQLYE